LYLYNGRLLNNLITEKASPTITVKNAFQYDSISANLNTQQYLSKASWFGIATFPDSYNNITLI